MVKLLVTLTLLFNGQSIELPYDAAFPDEAACTTFYETRGREQLAQALLERYGIVYGRDYTDTFSCTAGS